MKKRFRQHDAGLDAKILQSIGQMAHFGRRLSIWCASTNVGPT